jgi:Domain of unknown function (DUF1996)/Domain of unknown function (DUF4124)
MFKPNTQFSNAALLTAVLALFSTDSAAEIYKWRNARGVVQYSDRPPLASFTKATRSEIINALQLKDVCNLPVNKTIAGATLADFFGRSSIRKNNASTNLPSKSRPIFLAANKPVAVGAITPKTQTAAAQTPVTSSPATALSVPIANSTAANTGPASVAAPKPVTVDSAPKQILALAAPAAAETAPTTQAVPVTNSTTTNIVQVALMPAVDISKNMTQAIGYSTLRAQPTPELPTSTSERGAFRVACTPSHMSNDDPIVYPNQPGAAHHHTFFGNTSTNAKSDLAHLDIVGNSTCTGGSMNHSAYWIPSMINTSTNEPVKPDSAIFYYKSWAVSDQYITQPPKGLRMITGNSKATTGATSDGRYSCVTPSTGNGTPWTQTIPNCSPGTFLLMQIFFPQCWDGVNLDSPNHKDHMAQADQNLTTVNKCPASHPVAIPSIALSINFNVVAANQTKNWRLASDNYANTAPGGYSAHADWVNGWDEKIMAGFVKNCLNKALDCHAHLLGDGRMFF